MNLIENIKMALESILSNKLRSFLTMLGIIIGISSVIAIVSLGQGGQNSITGEFEKIGSASVSIKVKTQEAEKSDFITFEDVNVIKEKNPYVRYASPVVSGQGVARTEKKQRSAYFYGGNKDIFAINNNELVAGRFFTDTEYEEGKAVVVLDQSSAKRLFGTDDVVGRTMIVGQRSITKSALVIGVVESQFDMFGMGDDEDVRMPIIIYMPATYYKILYSEDNTTAEMVIMADKKENLESAGNVARNMLINRHGNRDRDLYRAESVLKQLDQINQVLGIFTTFIAAVAAISLLVGGVGVMNIMLVSVTERTREIGIRKAIGAKTGNILFQFLTESVIISCLGGILGLLFGLAGAFGIGKIAGITPSLSAGTIILAIAFSSAVGIFFGIYPARKAARLDPIEALRYE